MSTAIELTVRRTAFSRWMKIAAALAAALAGATGVHADGDGAALTEKYHCKACHAVDLRIVGPRFRDVAKKYAGDASAPEKLAAKIKSGGSGAWGAIPMPPRDVPDADLKPMVAWILSQG